MLVKFLKNYRGNLQKLFFKEYYVFEKCNLSPIYLQRKSSNIAVTGNEKTDKILNNVTGGKAIIWLKKYEDFVGLTEVRQAQTKVIEAEHLFLQSQTTRRNLQTELNNIQSKLKDISSSLDKVNRGDEKYLSLLTEEHRILKSENEISTLLSDCDKEERRLFSNLSSAVRESHEKERTRSERTKYWSIIGSCIGALIGIIGSTINSFMRIRQLKGIVYQSTNDSAQLRDVVTSLSTTVNSEREHMQNFVTELKDLIQNPLSEKSSLLMSNQLNLKGQANIAEETKRILSNVKKEENELRQHMEEIKTILSERRHINNDSNQIVHYDSELGNIINNNQRRLEVGMKLNALWTVTAIYGAFAIATPILYYLFKS